jgi:hypothetical protein
VAVFIDEKIVAGVVFGDTRPIRPAWFRWSARRIDIREITWAWSRREGRALLRHFSVTDGATLYELVYNAESGEWRLLRCEPCSTST